ncbi:MAG: class I SAM-dependent rRNA methyltransferase [Deltaproteobacteria bacterium]|nr:class I SAM-dependent rRNA methyltransferase [Deltaproteobacteria bacterium]
MKVRLTASGFRRVAAGNPWVKREHVADEIDRTADTVELTRVDGRVVATAAVAAGERIALRVLMRGDAPWSLAQLEARVRECAAWRARLFPGADAYRVVSGEADGIPGLFIDRFADTVVVQALTLIWDRRIGDLLDVVRRVFDPTRVVLRNDGSGRDFEGLPRERRVVFGESSGEAVFSEGAVRFSTNVLTDAKTGAFLDQRENHLRVGELAFGDVLDAFTYHGGFALHAAARARTVLALDERRENAEAAARNVVLNGFRNVKVETANAFDRLRAYERNGDRFDVVVLDPPGLAKRHAGIDAALRAYREINLRAFRIVQPGGLVVTCSCSGSLSAHGFAEVVRDAILGAHREVQLVERRGASRDHPVHPMLTETDYLKCFIYRVLR